MRLQLPECPSYWKAWQDCRGEDGAHLRQREWQMCLFLWVQQSLLALHEGSWHRLSHLLLHVRYDFAGNEVSVDWQLSRGTFNIQGCPERAREENNCLFNLLEYLIEATLYILTLKL